MASTLQDMLPWTSNPLIINAPMGGFAGFEIAVSVTEAGGLGQIGSIFDMKDLEQDLQKASTSLRKTQQFENSQTLPIGVGLLLFLLKIEHVLPVLKKFPPAVIWLFAAKDTSDYALWSTQLREACPLSKVWIQTGSVGGALELAKSCKPDVLVLQGSDAGGHGFEKGAGILSLFPEASDALEKNGFGSIPLVAAGGIVDGRGAAAALTLGAQGIVMGTRFLSSSEIMIHPKCQAALLAASDGGQNTVRTKLFDELRGPNIWPDFYNGRGLITDSYVDHVNGISIEKNRDLFKQASEEEDLGWGKSNRATVWSGTGVGLVTKVERAADIVEAVRQGARLALERTKARL